VGEPQYYNTGTNGGERLGMDLNLVDPSEVPVPPDEVRIRQMRITPVGDGRRLKVDIDLTPFQQPPSLHMAVNDSRGEEIASTSIIEAMAPRMSFTLHLRLGGGAGDYQVEYLDGPKVDEKVVTFQLD
jgi:hypothetical protein